MAPRLSRPDDFKRFLILATAIAIIAFSILNGCEGFQTTGVYTLIGIEVKNANVDSFLRSTTGYKSMFVSIKDVNGKVLWTRGSLIETGPSLQNFIVYLNPRPPTSLTDIQTQVSSLKMNINNVYGTPIISNFILSLPDGTFVNENGKPISTPPNTLIAAIGVFVILAAIYFIFIRSNSKHFPV